MKGSENMEKGKRQGQFHKLQLSPGEHVTQAKFTNPLFVKRVEKLHERFLEAAHHYPGLFHIAVSSDDPRLGKCLCTNFQVPESALLNPDDLGKRADEVCDNADALWKAFFGLFESPHWCVDDCLTLLDSTVVETGDHTWHGRFYYGDKPINDIHNDPGIAVELLDTLGKEAINVLDVCSNNWLSFLYESFPLRKIDFNRYRLNIIASVFCSPSDIFTTSAKAIELLSDNTAPSAAKIPEGIPTEPSSKPTPRLKVDTQTNYAELDGTKYKLSTSTVLDLSSV